MEQQQADQRHPRRQLRRLPVGLVRRARPGLDAQLHDLRPARRLVGLVVLQRGVRRALPAQQHVEIDQAKRESRWSSRCSRSSTRTRRTSCTAYTTIGEAVRSDRFACFQPQPDPGGVWLVQYGVHNYTTCCARPTEAGDCDGVDDRDRRASDVAARPSDGSDTAADRSAAWSSLAVLVASAAGSSLLRRRRGGERE